MTFLTILIAVIFYRNWFGEHPLSRILPFESVFDWAAERGIKACLSICHASAYPFWFC